MHISFVNNTEKWGGVKTWILSMAASFAEAGHGVSVYGQDPAFIARARQAGIESLLRPKIPDYSPFEVRYYRKKFASSGTDVVVVNVSKDIRTAGLAARSLGLSVIRRVGAPRDFPDSRKVRMDHKLMHPAFICCSKYTLDNLLRHAPHVARYEHVAIHPGTMIPEEFPRSPRRLPRLVTTSRLASDKRHLDLLGALLLLREKGLCLELAIVGDGPMRPTLESFVRENGLEDYVRFYGFSSDVGSFLQNAEIFVLPSLHEPLGIALEEALAYGLVPVARNEGGVPEIWPKGLEELLVEPEAGPQAFADVLERLVGWSGDRFLEAGRLARQTAVERFSQERQFAAFYAWVSSVVETHKAKKHSSSLRKRGQ